MKICECQSFFPHGQSKTPRKRGEGGATAAPVNLLVCLNLSPVLNLGRVILPLFHRASPPAAASVIWPSWETIGASGPHRSSEPPVLYTMSQGPGEPCPEPASGRRRDVRIGRIGPGSLLPFPFLEDFWENGSRGRKGSEGKDGGFGLYPFMRK